MSQVLFSENTEKIISKLAQEESGKRQYYRPIYSLHKWWARRPGALFRSLILSATKSDGDTNLFKELPNGDLSPESDYFQDHNLDTYVVLDPFMGGGTILIEANRLGIKIIGCDINPVSYWIVRESLKPIDLEKLDLYFHQLKEEAEPKIKLLYQTKCPHCDSTHGESLYVHWLRFVTCPHCEKEVYLFKRTLLNNGASRNKPVSARNPATIFCPKCFRLNKWQNDSIVTCQFCSTDFDPMAGNYDQGYFTCPHCKSEKISLIKILQKQVVQERIVAIEYWCPKHKMRDYKEPDEADLLKLDNLSKLFNRLKDSLIFPKQQILEGASSVRWRQHNYKYYFQVFNSRQLLAFNYLFKAILKIPEEEYRNSFFTIFSNSLEYNNMMTPYNYPHRKLHHLFNYHALPLTTTPVENCVWGVNNEGAGTYENCYLRYLRAKRYCKRPFDRYKSSSGTICTIFSKQESIYAEFASNFEDLSKRPKSAMLLAKDSSNLSEIPDKAVDFIITDPPYFDNIHYSELSNFFYVWLNNLITNHSYFRQEHVPTEQEAIVNNRMGKSEADYCKLLTAVFVEGARVLKDEGKLIFTFHHTNCRAWWSLFLSLVRSNFAVVNSLPVMSEYKVNPHLRNKQVMDMDLVLICAKHRFHDFITLEMATQKVLHVRTEIQAKVLNGNGTEAYLRYLGSFLNIATSEVDPILVTYDWFSETIAAYSKESKPDTIPLDACGDDYEIELKLL